MVWEHEKYLAESTLSSWFRTDFPDTAICPHKSDYCEECYLYHQFANFQATNFLKLLQVSIYFFQILATQTHTNLPPIAHNGEQNKEQILSTLTDMQTINEVKDIHISRVIASVFICNDSIINFILQKGRIKSWSKMKQTWCASVKKWDGNEIKQLRRQIIFLPMLKQETSGQFRGQGKMPCDSYSYWKCRLYKHVICIDFSNGIGKVAIQEHN